MLGKDSIIKFNFFVSCLVNLGSVKSFNSSGISYFYLTFEMIWIELLFIVVY